MYITLLYILYTYNSRALLLSFFRSEKADMHSNIYAIYFPLGEKIK